MICGIAAFFQCYDGTEIPEYQVCNNVINCPNGEDETAEQGCTQSKECPHFCERNMVQIIIHVIAELTLKYWGRDYTATIS